MAIIIKCVRGAGDMEGPSISDAMITSDEAARLRGKRWLDDNYYLTKKRTLKVPHKMTVHPGDWIKVSDGNLGLNNTPLHVRSYSISITPSAVWANIETAQYEEFSR